MLSRSAARRLVLAGAVWLDGVRITDPSFAPDPDVEHVLRVGRHWAKYIPVEDK